MLWSDTQDNVDTIGIGYESIEEEAFEQTKSLTSNDLPEYVTPGARHANSGHVRGYEDSVPAPLPSSMLG